MAHEETGDEWVDLSLMAGVGAFAVNSMVTMNEQGAGRAILLSVLDGDERPFHFLVDPDIAGRIGWELVGHATGYLSEFIEENFDPEGAEFEGGDDEDD